MGSADATPRRNFWRSPMAKTSLVHRFTQVLLNPSKEALKDHQKVEEDEEEDPVSVSASKLCSRRQRRMRLEMDVERLNERLQQETDLHSALDNAITRATGAFSTFPRNLPVDAQELLADVAMLEVAVSSLEEQIVGLEIQIQHERDKRLRSATRIQAAPPLSLRKTRGSKQEKSEYPYKATDLTVDRFSVNEGMPEGPVELACEDGSHRSRHYQPCISRFETITTILHQEDVGSSESSNSRRDKSAMTSMQEVSTSRENVESDIVGSMESDSEDTTNGCESRRECIVIAVGSDLHQSAMNEKNSQADDGASSSSDGSIQGKLDKLWRKPNKLSQEMVSCMIGIYCHLADPSEAGKHILSDNVPSPSSPFGHVTSSTSFSSLSDLSSLSFVRSPPSEAKVKEEQGAQNCVDPYRTHDKLAWGDIGRYSAAVEVSWMSVGKEQLEYAADALRIFRSLVEQLSQVNATSLSHDEKLAFWINIYNALMMHAYLAYGVPKNDVKYFALMQKAAYTVGGHFFNAMAIEHVLLRGKAPSYRPQIALLLALHKVKIPEGATKFAISRPEPLVAFALSCGAWSSPAVRVYTPETVQVQLQAALHDYVRASVGISRHGKVLIPKLMHCYARDLNMLKPKGDQTDEGRALVLWLSSFLPAHQAHLLRDVVCRHAHHPPQPASTLIAVQPFNFRLRYLFLHSSLTGCSLQ